MKQYLSKILLVIAFVVSGWFFLGFGKNYFPFHGDALGYYMYLPSVFVYHNLSALDWLPADKGIDQKVAFHYKSSFDDKVRSPKGYYIIKYTYAIAAMESPFFFIAHIYEKITGKQANGFSNTYEIMLKIAMLFYTLLGIFLLYKILKNFFDNITAQITIFLILIGSNLFWFTFYQAGMSHVPLFFLYTFLLFATIQLHKKYDLKWLLLTGFTAGLITIIRPTDIISLLIPVCYNIYSIDSLAYKLKRIQAHKQSIIWFGMAFIIPILPQMVYWRKFAGSWLYYSYVNESFNWTSPMVWDGLFSAHNGWLFYSPIMIFAILGFAFMSKIKEIKFPLFVITPLYIYIIYSWYCYNYINGLGSRPMIHLYPLLAFPMAGLIQYLNNKNVLIKCLFAMICVFFISVNLSYSYLVAKGILISEESNYTYNFHMLFKTEANYNDMVTYDIGVSQPDTSRIRKVATLQCMDFEDSLSNRYIPDTSKKSKFIYCMWDHDEYMPTHISIPYSAKTFKKGDLLKASGQFYCWKPYTYFKHFLVLEIRHGDKIIHHYYLPVDNKIGLTEPKVNASDFRFTHIVMHKWGNIFFYVPIPDDVEEGDTIHMFIWNIGKRDALFMDNLCLEQYRNR